MRLAHTEPVTLRLSAALSGFLLCDLKSTPFAHSVALSHWSHNTLRGILPPAMSHWFVMPLFLCASPVNRCECWCVPVSILNYCWRSTLSSPICCSDLYFVFHRLYSLAKLCYLYLGAWIMSYFMCHAVWQLWFQENLMWSFKVFAEKSVFSLLYFVYHHNYTKEKISHRTGGDALEITMLVIHVPQRINHPNIPFDFSQ